MLQPVGTTSITPSSKMSLVTANARGTQPKSCMRASCHAVFCKKHWNPIINLAANFSVKSGLNELKCHVLTRLGTQSAHLLAIQQTTTSSPTERQQWHLFQVFQDICQFLRSSAQTSSQIPPKSLWASNPRDETSVKYHVRGDNSGLTSHDYNSPRSLSSMK